LIKGEINRIADNYVMYAEWFKTWKKISCILPVNFFKDLFIEFLTRDWWNGQIICMLIKTNEEDFFRFVLCLDDFGMFDF
jgi:hypothetical protein